MRPSASPIDRVFARLNRGEGLFAEGFGAFELHRRHGAAATDLQTVDQLDVSLGPARRVGGGWVLVEGEFQSPLAEALPRRTATARLWWLRPAHARAEPVWIQLAGTNEAGPRRRLRLARALARHGMSSLILENPFYGLRAPRDQRGDDLRTVADMLLMGRATARESRALLGWLGERGHVRRGISGYSMGGHMAALAAATFPEPIACAALATGLSAVPIFCSDALSRSIRWDVLLQRRPDARALLAELVALSDLDRFGPPSDPRRAVLVGARADAYVRPDEVRRLHAHWPGSELRWCSGGHVIAYLRRAALVRAMADAMHR